MKILLQGIKPVSTNDMYMPVATRGRGGKYYGRFVASPALREYKEAIHRALCESLGRKAHLDETKTYKLYIEVSYPKDEFMDSKGELKQRDASNVIKALEDGFFESLRVNDKQNIEVEVKKFYNEDKTHIIYAEITEVDKSIEDLNRGLDYYKSLL